jgi:hypothetical protein
VREESRSRQLSSPGTLSSMPKKREPIDDMIDAHLWMRAVAKRKAKKRWQAREQAKRKAASKAPKSSPSS